MHSADNRTDLLGPEWTLLLIAMLALGMLGFWVSAHMIKHLNARRRFTSLVSLAARIGLASATLWMTFQFLARVIYLATPWPLFLTAVLAGIESEVQPELGTGKEKVRVDVVLLQ